MGWRVPPGWGRIYARRRPTRRYRRPRSNRWRWTGEEEVAEFGGGLWAETHILFQAAQEKMLHFGADAGGDPLAGRHG